MNTIDISMPVMDGLTATQEIRKIEQELAYPPTTVIVLTGLGAGRAEEAFQRGVDSFLTKPVALAKLKEMLLPPSEEGAISEETGQEMESGEKSSP